MEVQDIDVCSMRQGVISTFTLSVEYFSTVHIDEKVTLLKITSSNES